MRGRGESWPWPPPRPTSTLAVFLTQAPCLGLPSSQEDGRTFLSKRPAEVHLQGPTAGQLGPLVSHRAFFVVIRDPFLLGLLPLLRQGQGREGGEPRREGGRAWVSLGPSGRGAGATAVSAGDSSGHSDYASVPWGGFSKAVRSILGAVSGAMCSVCRSGGEGR